MNENNIEKSLKDRANNLIDNSKYITNSIIEISELVSKCISNSGKIFFCGNGGSAAEAQHMAAEYCATLDHHKPREGMAALSLTTDTSFITAWSNDFGYDGIFERQLMTLSEEGDLLFAYSTSGNSKNVCKAAKFAFENNIHVVSMTGAHNETELENFSTITFKAPSLQTPNIQEIHTIVGHEVCQMVEKNLFNF